jgi:serine protease
MRLLIVLLAFIAFPSFTFSQSEATFREKTLILKVKPQYFGACQLTDISLEELEPLKKQLGVEKLFKKYPNAQLPLNNTRSASNSFSDRQVDITKVYEWNYTSEINVLKAVVLLQRTGLFEYVEPAYIHEVFFTPNDALVGKQYHLENIRAFEAWDIDTGSADVTVGIVDTGVDWDHPDLVNALRYNENDPIDGIDNDSNGLVDDYRGWNFHDGNNDPDEKSWSHGTHVAGLAGASTNNGIGVIGTSYSSKVLAIKAGSFSQITAGYEGLQYAADMGCEVINCSWGSSVPSAAGLDVVRYAVFNQNAVITGGAGNGNSDQKFYPASFQEVISVGGTDTINDKYDASNYNFDVDILAPGTLVFSTKNGTYDTESGTSMSAPIVAGAAALLLSRFPDLSPMQVKAHLENTADASVLEREAMLPFSERLGAGLLDMRAMLDTVASPYITAEEIVFTDNDNGAFNLGDEIEVGFELVNYLAPSQSITVILRPIDTNNNVQMIDSVWTLGALGTNQRANNYTSPFRFKLINENGPYNQTLVFRILISDGTYSNQEFAETIIKPDYLNVNENNIFSTITSNGNIGYTGEFFRKGDGFEHSVIGEVLYEGGLMIGYQSPVRKQVVDRIRGTGAIDRDFTSKTEIVEVLPQGLEAFRAEGSFVDTSATLDEIGLEIHQAVTAYADEGHENYIILQYDVINKSGADLDSIYVGYFADWDIENPSKNRAYTIYPVKLGYVSNIYLNDFSAGIQLLSDQFFNSYMIDNGFDGAGGVHPYDSDGYSTDDKFLSLTSNRYDAGSMSGGNDVIQTISTKGQFLAANDTLSVRFAILAAETSGLLQQAAYNAFDRENGYRPGQNIDGDFGFVNAYPMPMDNYFTLEFDLKESIDFNYQIIDIQGKILESRENLSFYQGRNRARIDVSGLSSGVFFMKITSDSFEYTLPIEKLKR